MKPEAIVVGRRHRRLDDRAASGASRSKTRLIDRWEPGHSRASSTDYNRVIRAIHGRDEFYTRWARESRLRWMELQAETGQKLYYECGALILATAGHCHWEDATAETFTKLGVPFYRFSPDEMAVRFPQFDPTEHRLCALRAGSRDDHGPSRRIDRPSTCSRRPAAPSSAAM